MKERKRTKVEEWRGSDAARGDVTWRAASGSQSSKAEVGHSDEPWVGVNRKGMWEDQSSVCGVGGGGVCDEERFCRDPGLRGTGVDDDRSLEERGFVPSAVCELLRVKYICDMKCDEMGFWFGDLAGIVTEEGSTPHTIYLCRDCYDCRLVEQGEPKVSNAVWKEMIRRKTSRGKLRGAFGSAVESDSPSKKNVPSSCWKRQQKRCGWKQISAGNMSHHAMRSLSSCDWAVICVWKALQCDKRLR